MINNKPLLYLAVSALLVPVAVPANNNPLQTIAPIWINDIGNAADKSEMLKSKVIQLASDTANQALDEVEKSATEHSDFTHLDITLGTSAFGLGSNSDGYGEVIGVYRLSESANSFVFNQSSVINQDSRTTLNTGFGIRSINPAETLILGVNAFYDYELSSGHRRASLGIEALTSAFELRANNYQAQSGTVVYNGINETALDGYDYSVAAVLPYFYSSSVFYKKSSWKDDASYITELSEWGIKAEFLPNVVFTIANQKQDQKASKVVGSITYSQSFGGPKGPPKQMQDGNWSSSLKPIREKLYKPVERENRIIKKAIKLGVTVSGY